MNVVSRASRTTVRKRTNATAPTKPNARAMESPTTSITIEMIIVSSTRLCTMFLE